MSAGGVLSERKVLETILDPQCSRLAWGTWILLQKLPWEIGRYFFAGAVGTWRYEIMTLGKSWDEAMRMDCVCFVSLKGGSRMFVSVKLFIWTFHTQEFKSRNSVFDELEVFFVFAPTFHISVFSVLSPRVMYCDSGMLLVLHNKYLSLHLNSLLF